MHLERQGEALTGGETKRAGNYRLDDAGGGGGGAAAGSPLSRSAAAIKQHASFIFIPPGLHDIRATDKSSFASRGLFDATSRRRITTPATRRWTDESSPDQPGLEGGASGPGEAGSFAAWSALCVLDVCVCLWSE